MRAAVVAGTVSGAAHIAAMDADLRLIGQNADDLKLLGRPLARDRALAKPVGAVVHRTNAVALAVIYPLVAHDRLPGPSWARGAVFAHAENAALYPVAMLEDHHPGIRDGRIDAT